MSTACNTLRMDAEGLKSLRMMWWQGHDDKSMAERLGLSKSYVCATRRRLGLDTNGVQGRKPWKRYKITLAETGKVMADGTLRECMEQLGKSAVAVRSMVQDSRRGKCKKWAVEVI